MGGLTYAPKTNMGSGSGGFENSVKFVENSYIADIITGEILRFQFFQEEIVEEVGANYNAVEIIGRSHPIYGYSGSSGRSLSLELQFSEEAHMSDRGLDVEGYVRWLQSLCFPDYMTSSTFPGGGFMRPPHRVLLRLGSFLRRVCLVESVSATRKAPWNVYAGRESVATVALSLKEIGIVPVSYDEVRTYRMPEKGDFSGGGE